MNGVTGVYEVHGVRLGVEAQSRSLASTVEALLRPYASADRTAPSFRLSLAYGDPAADRDRGTLRVFWSGPLPDGSPLVFRCGHGRREIMLVGSARADIDLAHRRARITVRPGAEEGLTDPCILPVLCEFLAQGGHYVVHAASLVSAAGGQPSALLLSGGTGAGKTTTALGLAKAGMGLLADDVTFVTSGPEHAAPRVWGLRTHCKVSQTSLALLPWLARLPQVPGQQEGEFSVDAASLGAAEPTSAIAAGAVIFLDPRNGQEHRLRPMDKATALERLTRENVRAYEAAADGAAGQAFGALADLVRHSRTYGLSAGPSLEGLCDMVLPLVKR